MTDLADITGFDWDEGNARKNEKHNVSMAEAEQVFFNAPLLVLEDFKHSNQEPRFHALGRSDENRQLHITFTLRQSSEKMANKNITSKKMTGEKIRIISARNMHKKERAIYEKAT